MRIFIIGENSRLTKAIILNSTEKIILVKKSIYSTLSDSFSIDYFIDKLMLNTNDVLLVTKAIINPKHDVIDLYRWNYDFPRNLIAILEKKKLHNRVFFLGSFFEKTGIQNNYINSKRKLSHYITHSRFKFVRPHIIRLHTLFGIGLPAENMFLGQIYYSLKNDINFEMSHGNQFRQYHDYKEISFHILNIIKSKRNKKTIELNGDEWIQLKVLAKSIFSHFNKLHLLKIGLRSSSPFEILNIENFNKHIYAFSPSIKLIKGYLQNLIKK